MKLILLLLAACGLALPAAASTDPRGHPRADQEAAYKARQQGQILSLTTIRSRIQIRGGDFIGAEFDPSSMVYRLKFMRGGEVIFVDVDARTGRILGRSN